MGFLMNRRRSHILPHVREFLLFGPVIVGAFAADVEMAGFLFAAFDAHEFVELEHASLAAGPALGAFVEDGLARVVDAFLALSG